MLFELMNVLKYENAKHIAAGTTKRFTYPGTAAFQGSIPYGCRNPPFGTTYPDNTPIESIEAYVNAKYTDNAGGKGKTASLKCITEIKDALAATEAAKLSISDNLKVWYSDDDRTLAKTELYKRFFKQLLHYSKNRCS